MKIANYLQQKYSVNTYVDRNLNLIKGKGVYLYDDNGKKYLDLMSNYGVSIFGYNNQKINSALTAQLHKISTLHASFTSDTRARAVEKLIKRCGEKYEQVYLSNSGAEAIETALKFAVLKTGKKKFIVCENGYHGKTLGALSATSGEKYKQPFMPLLWNFVSIPFNNIDALRREIDKDTAAFIVEPIQGEGGIYVPDEYYLYKVKEVCQTKGILLIIDEIQTGLGRTGKFLASEGVAGDILCLGKGLAGGIPVGATIISEEIASAIPKHIHSSTFGGNPLACAGIISTLRLLDKARLVHISAISKYMLQQLRMIESKVVLEVRGKGLMIGLVVNKDQRNIILKKLQEENVLVIPAGENVIRFLPPYILTKKDSDFAIKKLIKVLKGID